MPVVSSDDLGTFAAEVRRLKGSGEPPLYPAFKVLLEAVYPSPRIVDSLLRAPAAGYPDFTITQARRVLNWVEVKAPDVSVDPLPAPDQERFGRYQASLPHVVLTNGWTWILYVDQDQVGRVEVASEWLLERQELTAEEERELRQFFDRIAALTPTTAVSYDEAVDLLAMAARLIESAVLDVANEGLPDALVQARGSFTELLQTNPSDPSEISIEEFAGAFAQMCTFGYLLARVEHGEDIEPVSAIDALDTAEHPFLKSTLHAVVAPDPALEDALQGVLRTACDAVNGAAPRLAGPSGEWEKVPYVYENFFAAYKPEDRFKFGVFYTPPEITRFQTREVRRQLVDNFGLRGLTDPAARFLDPACGTGTYLLALAEEALKEAEEHGLPIAAALEELFRDRVVGFDVSPGPAAVAQARLTAWLRSHGVALGTRFPVYTVNSLTPPHTGAGSPGAANLWVDNITKEQEAGDEVKRDTPILVILGNPPWGDRPRETFQIGPTPEHNLITEWARGADAAVINLYDLYVAFWRLAAGLLLERPAVQEPRGVISYITNRSWLRGRAFRTMRSWMRGHHPSAHIVDLGGDIRAGARADDQPVFAIKAGSAISTLAFGGSEMDKTSFRRLRGTRLEKLSALQEDLPPAQEVAGAGGDSFGPVDWGPLSDAPLITHFFRRNFPGVKTHRDHLVIDVTWEGLLQKVNAWNALRGREREKVFGQTSDRQVTAEIAEPAAPSDPGYQVLERYVVPHRYRPLDDRYLYADRRFIDRPGTISSYYQDGARTPALITMDTRTGQGPVVIATDYLPGYNSFRGSYETHVFPLSGPGGTQVTLGGDEDVLADWATAWAKGFRAGPEEVGMYLLALGHAPSYSEAFLEALETEIVRLPPTVDEGLFRRGEALGRRLFEAWTLRVPEMGVWEQHASTGEPLGAPEIHAGEIGFGNGDRLTGLHPRTAEFEVSNYPVMLRFLEARQHLPLTTALGGHICRVAGAVAVLLHAHEPCDALLADVMGGPRAPGLEG